MYFYVKIYYLHYHYRSVADETMIVLTGNRRDAIPVHPLKRTLAFVYRLLRRSINMTAFEAEGSYAQHALIIIVITT